MKNIQLLMHAKELVGVIELHHK